MAKERETAKCPVCRQNLWANRLDSHIRKAHPAYLEASRATPRQGMSRRAIFALAAVAMLLTVATAAALVLNKPPHAAAAPHYIPPAGIFPTDYVNIETDRGEIGLALYRNETPNTVLHFLSLVQKKYYDGTIFHAAKKDYIIEGGGYLANLSRKLPPANALALETSPLLKNKRGTVGMAHGNDSNSAVSEFYINLKDNANLDPGKTKPGFCIFAKVISGMDVVDGIGSLPVSNQTAPKGAVLVDVPLEHVVMNSVVKVSAPG